MTATVASSGEPCGQSDGRAADQQTVARAGYVQHALGHYEANVEQRVGGGHVGGDGQGESHGHGRNPPVDGGMSNGG